MDRGERSEVKFLMHLNIGWGHIIPVPVTKLVFAGNASFSLVDAPRMKKFVAAHHKLFDEVN